MIYTYSPHSRSSKSAPAARNLRALKFQRRLRFPSQPAPSRRRPCRPAIRSAVPDRRHRLPHRWKSLLPRWPSIPLSPAKTEIKALDTCTILQSTDTAAFSFAKFAFVIRFLTLLIHTCLVCSGGACAWVEISPFPVFEDSFIDSCCTGCGCARL